MSKRIEGEEKKLDIGDTRPDNDVTEQAEEVTEQADEEANPVSVSLKDHFTVIVKPRKNTKEAFFSFRYFTEKQYFHRKNDRLTSAKKALLEKCPRPRITSFSQGSIYFPYEDREEVLKMISYDVMSQSTIYWNQMAYDMPNEGFRLALDFDSDTRVVTDAEIIQIARVLWKTLKDYYTDFEKNPIDIYIAKCGPRIKKNKLSTGVHIIAHVRVSMAVAQQIIYGFNLRLKLDSSIDMTGIVVDDGIYKVNGNQCSLRMIYCNKLEKCPLCRNTNELRQGCEFCDRLGEVISTSTYEPSAMLNPSTGKHDKEYFLRKNPDFFQMVKNYSLWPEPIDETHIYVKPLTDPVYESNSKNAKKRPAAGISTTNKPLKPIKLTDPAYVLLEDFIHTIVWDGKKWWDGIRIDNIALTENERIGFVYISGLGSTCCPYAQKDHENNRIWFSITRKGILTCYCHSDKKEYGCKTKDRIQFQVPGDIYQKIFGIEGHPSFHKTSDLEKNFSFDEFVKRQKTTHQYVHNEEDTNREKLLKRLTDFYHLGAATQE